MMNEKVFEKLLLILPNNRKDAVSMKELSSKMEMSSREVRQIVLEARRNGYPILSDDNGYWESEDKKDFEEYVLRRRNVAKTIFSYTQKMIKRRERHNEEK